jgi:hypothetical protein
MIAHQLVETLRKGNMITPPKAEGFVRNEKTYAAVGAEWCHQADFIAGAHKFDFGSHLETIADNAALRDTATEFIRTGVFRLPFDDVYYEGSVNVQAGRMTFGVAASVLVTNGEGQAIGGDGILGFRPFVRRPDSHWVDTGVVGIVDPTGDVDFHTIQDYTPEDDVAHLLYAAMGLVLSGTIALQSKDTGTERVEAPAKLNNRRAKRGRPLVFEHRVVRVAPSLSGDPATAVYGGRRSPRLHWRRGHVRTLFSGCMVPVSACLVGSSELGFVAHDYRVDPPAAA